MAKLSPVIPRERDETLDAVMETHRAWIDGRLHRLGYVAKWRLFQASDFGVPQLRPRVVLVAIERKHAAAFAWPSLQAQVHSSMK